MIFSRNVQDLSVKIRYSYQFQPEILSAKLLTLYYIHLGQQKYWLAICLSHKTCWTNAVIRLMFFYKPH